MKRSPKETNPAKKKTKTKAQLMKECLTLWSLAVRTKQRTCRLCNSEDRLQGHHIRSSRHHATLLDLDNGLCTCFPCHSLQHFNPELFLDKVIDVIGQKEYNRLKVKSQTIFKYTTKDLVEMKDHLKARLISLEADYGKI